MKHLITNQKIRRKKLNLFNDLMSKFYHLELDPYYDPYE
jgi:hypothetical protein